MALRLLSAPQRAETVTRRGHSKAPADLARLIDLVNVERLYERELRDPLDAVLDAMARNPQVPTSELRDLYARGLRELLAPETRRFLGPPENSAFNERWQLLESAGEVLSAIARRSR